MKLSRRSLLAAALLLGGAARVQAASAPAEVRAALPQARLQGSGLMRFFGLRVYAARLWTGANPVAAGWATVPFALELEYARELKGAEIAERSLVEMQRQGEIAPATAQRWLALMKQIFPDVKDGDRITGIHEPGQGARFFLNGHARGAPVADEDFSRVFFGIWLSPRSSEPELRAALLGSAS